MASFLSLHTALSGIRAGQVGLDTASHNIANAGTVGYTRQRVLLAQRPPLNSIVGQIGTGVDVTGIARTRDAFLDGRARTSAAEYGRTGTTAELLSHTEAILGEPDEGLSTALSSVFDAFDDWALEPSAAASRRQVLSALEGLSTRARAVTSGWDSLAQDTAVDLRASTEEANGNLTRLAELNRLIPTAIAQGQPNQLLDERDRLLDELSASLGTASQIAADGSVTVTLPGAPADLVSGLTVNPLTVAADHALSVLGTDVTAGGRSGGLQGYLRNDLPALQARFDGFLTELTTTLNDQHATGFDSSGAAGGPLLAFTPGLAVTDLHVAITDTDGLAAADAAGGGHNGRNAQALADLREGSPGGQPSLSAELTSFVVRLAGDVRTAMSAADSQRLLNVAATSARQSAHGVSLDEEMVALVQWQRSLEAAARVMTTVDEALQVLIMRTGIVGR